MKMKRVSEEGIAALELSAFAVVLLTTLMLGIGLGRYVQNYNLLNEIIANGARSVSATDVRLGESGYVQDPDSISQSIERLNAQIITSLRESFPQLDQGAFSLTVLMASQRVAPDTGVQSGMPEILHVESGGSLPSGTTAELRREVIDAFRSGSIELAPVPSAMWGGGSSQYCPFIYCLGLSLEVDASSGFLGQIVSALGLSRRFKVSRISRIRAEV